MVAQFREVTRFCHVITSVVKEALRGASKRARISRARFRTRGIRATVPPVIPWLKSNFNVTAGNLANTAANFLARANHLRVDSLERERERRFSSTFPFRNIESVTETLFSLKLLLRQLAILVSHLRCAKDGRVKFGEYV